MKHTLTLLLSLLLTIIVNAQALTEKKYEEYQNRYRASVNFPNLFQYEGEIAPEWEFKLYGSDSTMHLKNYKGTKVLLVLTSTDCGYCILALPMLKQLQIESDTSNFLVIAVYGRLSHIPVSKHINKYDINYKCYRYNGNFTKTITNAVPGFMVINEESVVMQSILGYSKEGWTEKIIRNYLYNKNIL